VSVTASATGSDLKRASKQRC